MTWPWFVFASNKKILSFALLVLRFLSFFFFNLSRLITLSCPTPFAYSRHRSLHSSVSPKEDGQICFLRFRLFSRRFVILTSRMLLRFTLVHLLVVTLLLGQGWRHCKSSNLWGGVFFLFPIIGPCGVPVGCGSFERRADSIEAGGTADPAIRCVCTSQVRCIYVGAFKSGVWV